MALRHHVVLLFITFLCAFAHSTVFAKTFTLTVLDEAGKPIPKAKLDYQALPKPQDWDSTHYYTLTDDRGQLVISIDTDPILKEFVISIKTPGYTPYLANWDNPDTDPIPNSYTATLEKALTVGGKVLDSEGKPVAEAMISFFICYDEKRVRSLGDTIGHSKVYSFTGTTDANGMWKYESLSPEQINSNTRIVITHNDFSELHTETQFSNLLPQDDGSFKTTFRLEKGITVKGRVTDTSGKPIAGAFVVGRNENLSYSGLDEKTKTETDAEGNYMLNNWIPSSDAHIGVWKAGMMAALQKLPSFNKENPPTADFVLKPAGKPITVKIIDKNGKPIQGFYIVIERWKDIRMLSHLFLTGKESLPRTDAEGRWTWKEAPEEGAVFDMFLSDLYMDLRNKTVTPREEEYVFTSGEPLNITGSVTDAETGAAVQKFNVFLGIIPLNGDKMYWTPVNESGAYGSSSNGKYRLGRTYPAEKPVGVKIEAEGYESAISREIEPTEGRVTIDFAMKKLSADQVAIHGTILQPDGKPAEKATVAMATRESSVGIQNGGKIQRYGNRQPIVTNKEGVFTFPYIDFEAESERRYQPIPGREKVDFILIVLHDTGFKRITQQDWNALDEKKAVTLEPWGRIEGTVKQGTQPGKNLTVQCIIFFSEDGLGDPNEPAVFSDYDVITDESGKFVFDRVPPAFGRVGRTVQIDKNGMSTGSNMTGTFALKPGEVKAVTLGGIGRPITGKLVPAKEFETPLDWGFAHIECMPVPEKAQMPDATKLAKIKEIMETMVPKEIREGMDPAKVQEWIKTDDGKKFQAAMEEFTKDARAVEERNQRRVCAVAEDGTFRLDDIFEGDWQLTVQLYAPPSAENPYQRGSQIGKLDYQFSVAAIPNGVSDEPQDLGSLEVEKLVPPKPMPLVGTAAPYFEIKKIDPLDEDGKYEDKGEKLRLSDYKGKFVILDFWAMWCGPCLAKVPELQKLYEKIKDDERFVMIGLSLDGADSEERLGKFIVNRKMPWLHGLAGDWNGDAVRSYGVRAIPAMMLIDPDGKVELSNPELPVLVKKIEELL